MGYSSLPLAVTPPDTAVMPGKHSPVCQAQRPPPDAGHFFAARDPGQTAPPLLADFPVPATARGLIRINAAIFTRFMFSELAQQDAGIVMNGIFRDRERGFEAKMEFEQTQLAAAEMAALRDVAER